MIPFRSIYFDDEPIKGRVMDIFEALPVATQDVSLFFVHGQNWKSGSRVHYHFLMPELTRRGFDCASTDYRLEEVDVFDQVGDIRTGLEVFVQDLVRRKRPSRIILVGRAAGAHLSLLAGLAKPQECGLPKSPLTHSVEIAGMICEAAPYIFEPWEDIFPHIWTAMQKAAGFSHKEHPHIYSKASPIQYVRRGMPPIFSIHAQNEHVFPFILAEAFGRKASAVDAAFTTKTYARTEHGFFRSFVRRQEREAFEDILRFVENPHRFQP